MLKIWKAHLPEWKKWRIAPSNQRFVCFIRSLLQVYNLWNKIIINSLYNVLPIDIQQIIKMYHKYIEYSVSIEKKCITEGILKQMLQNYSKILKIYFLVTENREWIMNKWLDGISVSKRLVYTVYIHLCNLPKKYYLIKWWVYYSFIHEPSILLMPRFWTKFPSYVVVEYLYINIYMTMTLQCYINS